VSSTLVVKNDWLLLYRSLCDDAVSFQILISCKYNFMAILDISCLSKKIMLKISKIYSLGSLFGQNCLLLSFMTSYCLWLKMAKYFSDSTGGLHLVLYSDYYCILYAAIINSSIFHSGPHFCTKLLPQMMEYILGGAHNTYCDRFYAKRDVWHGRTGSFESFV